MTSAGTPASSSPGLASLLVPGQRFGQFVIGRLLGRGGMGEVYEAEEIESGRHVALKLFNRALGDQAERERFLREGQLAASISHPNCVCVFGADEINGMPVISMELAAGGTVKDLIKDRGQLPVEEAVEVTLQIVAGLEAAASKGVLHRDIKPANCFVDRDGVVKVGDFGLSISTLAREDTHLTLAGTILGTPAFASPEQLRGDPLDVRADIYSVGATLFCLLTGRAPFEETNILKLVTMVAQEEPPKVHELRSDVPRKLSAVIARCLAKKPGARFSDYAAVRAALAPFANATSHRVAASLRLRLVAWVLDSVLAGLASKVLGGIVFPGVKTPMQSLLLYAATAGLYFALVEGKWGASVGKRVFGLQVADEKGRRAHFSSVAKRTAAYVLVPYLIEFLVVALVAGPSSLVSAAFADEYGEAAAFGGWVLIGAMFATARRRNGLAGLHEIISGTRVVFRLQEHVAGVSAPTADIAVPDGGRRVGPYTLLSADCEAGRFAEAYDPALRRRVWIEMNPAASLPASRRDLNRPARLRWLGGKRQADECWDAYEGIDGTPFVTAVATAQRWAIVRRWMHELTAELVAGAQDGTLPELSFERLWIAHDGRMVLLDKPAFAPRASADRAGDSGLSAIDFLHMCVRSALAGQVAYSREQASSLSTGPVPLTAGKFLRELANDKFDSVESVGARLRALEHRPAEVSKGVRLAHLALTGVAPLLLSATATGVLLALHYSGKKEMSLPGGSIGMLVLLACTWLWIPFAVGGCMFALFARGGVALKAADIVVINSAGARASRIRCLVRAVVAWAPIFAGGIVCYTALKFGDAHLKHVATPVVVVTAVLFAALMALFGFGALRAVQNPQRGIQDRIARTWLVPR